MMSKPWFIKKSIFLFFFFYPLCRLATSFAADAPRPNQPDEPISITSNKMTVKSLEDKIVFEGNVSIKKGDLTIGSDRAEVFLKEKDSNQSKSPSSSILTPGSGAEKEVFRIETSGNVDIQQGDKHAKAQKAVYDKKREEIVLTGEPEAWEKDYRVKGKVITLFIAENRSLVEGSHVVIQPGNGKLKLGSK